MPNSINAITNAYKAQASDKAAPSRKNPNALPATSGCLETASIKPFVAKPIPSPAPTAPKPIAIPAPKTFTQSNLVFFFCR